MNHLPLIIKREYLTKVRNKSFVIMTFLSPIIMIGLIALVAYLSQLNNNAVRNIAVLDASGLVAPAIQNTPNVAFVVLEDISLETAKTLTSTQSYYGLLHVANSTSSQAGIPEIKFYSEETPSLSIISNLEQQLETYFTNLKLKSQGVDVAKIELAKTNVTISQESFLGQKTSKADSLVKLIFGGAAGYLLFMFIIIYGNMIMRSVIEEKTSRIIEIIISSVKPIQLMLGKIIGTSLAGVTQFVIWILLGAILISGVSALLGLDLVQATPSGQIMSQSANQEASADMVAAILQAFVNLPLGNLIAAFLVFFIGGYLLYSSFYAAIGAAVDNETDTQQFLFPVLMPLILAVYIGFFTVIEDPHGTVSTVFSFIPLTSPVVMLMRIPFGVPVWQQIVSVLILISTFMFTVWFAAKIYRVGILMYGKKASYKDILKWIKY
ncbi:ABC transporter permease [Bizionia sediminis]|uniref:ABC transporter permease n=1 Tax=Bizionia sediminis TaxID=1737064 RepID=A0ABW5KRS9_9FLAO